MSKAKQVLETFKKMNTGRKLLEANLPENIKNIAGTTFKSVQNEIEEKFKINNKDIVWMGIDYVSSRGNLHILKCESGNIALNYSPSVFFPKPTKDKPKFEIIITFDDSKTNYDKDDYYEVDIIMESPFVRRSKIASIVNGKFKLEV